MSEAARTLQKLQQQAQESDTHQACSFVYPRPTAGRADQTQAIRPVVRKTQRRTVVASPILTVQNHQLLRERPSQRSGTGAIAVARSGCTADFQAVSNASHKLINCGGFIRRHGFVSVHLHELHLSHYIMRLEVLSIGVSSCDFLILSSTQKNTPNRNETGTLQGPLTPWFSQGVGGSPKRDPQSLYQRKYRCFSRQRR